MAKLNEIETLYQSALSSFTKGLNLMKEGNFSSAQSSLLRAKAIANEVSFYANMTSELYNNSQTMIRNINTRLAQISEKTHTPNNSGFNI